MIVRLIILGPAISIWVFVGLWMLGLLSWTEKVWLFHWAWALASLPLWMWAENRRKKSCARNQEAADTHDG